MWKRFQLKDSGKLSIRVTLCMVQDLQHGQDIFSISNNYRRYFLTQDVRKSRENERIF